MSYEVIKATSINTSIMIIFYCAINGVSYTRNAGYTLENLKWADRVVTLIICRRKVWASHMWICFFCAIIGVLYIDNPGYTLENSKWAERVILLAIRRRKIRAFHLRIYLIVGTLVTWAIYTQGQLLLWSSLIITGVVSRCVPSRGPLL